MKESTKKEALTMEFPLTLWPEWMLQNLLPPLLCSQNTTPWMLFLNYGTSTIQKNGTPFSS
jgi:hypothetical protein